MNKRKLFNVIILTSMILLNSVTVLYGQKKTTIGPSKQANEEEAKMAINRTLLVLLTENDTFNTKIKEIVNKHWVLNKNIEFVNNESLRRKIQNNKYAVLLINEVIILEYGNYTFINQYIRFSLKLSEKINKKKALFYQNVAYIDKNMQKLKRAGLFMKKEKEYTFDSKKTDILFALDRIQNHIKARAEGKKRWTVYNEMLENSGILATKTLLIDKNDIEKKMTEEKIKKLYPYKYKITTKEEIENKYLSRDKKFAFVEIAPLGYAKGSMFHYIINCENGQILSTGEIYNGFWDRVSNLVSKGHIKIYVKNSKRKGWFIVQ